MLPVQQMHGVKETIRAHERRAHKNQFTRTLSRDVRASTSADAVLVD